MSDRKSIEPFTAIKLTIPEQLQSEARVRKTPIQRWILSRALFELHAGRKHGQTPSGLSIDQLESPLSTKNESPRSTSKELIEALGKIGEEYGRHEGYAGRIDLSYTDAAVAALDRGEAARQAAANAEAARTRERDWHPKDILIEYLRLVKPTQQPQAEQGQLNENPQVDIALIEMFDNRFRGFLRKRRLDVTDMMTWTWVLTADTAERAATRLACVGNMVSRDIPECRVVPNFVFVFLLRRRTVNAGALKTLLIYAWHNMERLSREMTKRKALRIEKGLPLRSTDDMLGMDEFIFMLVAIRLLRKAREVLPAACESITALVCRYLDGTLYRRSATAQSDPPDQDTAALSFMYNSMLKLLAEPARLHPFRSATHQQRAQFSILRRMNQFDPPLVVDRRGYRAVTQMQLMHKKTSREREWAHLKARSWPPWKEERLGIDADIGPEFGTSRAREVLDQAREAGYATDGWDDAASVMSGWDTDGSPTIQIRTVLKAPTTLSNDRASEAYIWAARVKATRTLDEAWSAFLSYEDSGTAKKSAVYEEMFHKIFYDTKRKTAQNAQDINLSKTEKQQPLPGDGPEVWPAPVSPQEAIYVRTAPPSIDEFSRKMVNDGIRPGGSFLALLIRRTDSLSAGVQYLKASTLPSAQLSVLLNRHAGISEDEQLQSLLEDIPPKVFAAFIGLLARSSNKIISRNDSSAADDGVSSLLVSLRPLNQAIRLVHGRKPRERPPWYSLLAALARPWVITPFTSYTGYQTSSAIANWKTSCWLLECMEELDVALDLDALKILCTGLEHAIFEAEEVIHQKMGIENVKHIPRSDLELVLERGLALIKQIFKDIVRYGSTQQDIPQSVIDAQEQCELDLTPVSTDGENHSLHLDDMEDQVSHHTSRTGTYLPPACLLPKLLEVPNTAQIHSFIRILGLRRDYQGILDLIEWMALHADDIKRVTEEQRQSSIMLRRCMTATRVFLERSWLYYEQSASVQVELSQEKYDGAPKEIWLVVRDTIIETEHWGGWATDEEVERYCMNGRFI